MLAKQVQVNQVLCLWHLQLSYLGVDAGAQRIFRLA